jgi:hypothetical protein
MASPKQPPPSSGVPPELAFDEKWDRLVDVSLRRVVYGTLAGGLAALVLLRGPCVRGVVTAFGAGCGAGSAWTSCSQDVSRAGGGGFEGGSFVRGSLKGGVVGGEWGFERGEGLCELGGAWSVGEGLGEGWG